MTRVHALFACLILIAAPLAGCLSGDEIEELVDDIVGCMDENAANYDDNATSELVGDCIYMATMETFIEAMSDVRSIEEMLEDTPKAGYSQSISMSEWSDDLGMQMDIEMDEAVMADLDNDAVHVHNSLSVVPMMTMSYTHTQIGEVVNVHYAFGGMMAGAAAESGSYQTRDATPSVMEVLSEQVGLFSSGEEDEGMVIETPDSDVDEIPEDAVTTITLSDDMESQTMTMEYTEDGAEITMTIHINQNEDLMSFTMASDNGSATMDMEYQMMWGDSVVIEVDDTLPKTSIPVWIDFPDWDDDDDDTFLCDNGNEIPMDYVDDGWDDCGDGSDESDDGGDDTFYCDNGNEIPMDWVDDGADDCGDGSDESDGVDVYWHSYYGGYCEWEGNDEDGADETVWWCKNSQDDDYWETWWYYCEHHDSDWHCTDDYGQNEGYENSSDGTSYLDTLPPVINGPDPDEDGAPSPEEAMESVDANGDDFMSYQEFQDAWESDPENFELDYDEVTILFDDCDYDDNDLIDIDEMQCFIDGIVDMAPDEGDEDPEQMFGHIDTDDDGYVSLQDIIDFSNENEAGDDSDDEIDEEELSDWFSWCDTDGDDLLNLDEFTTCVEDDDDDEGDGSDEDGSGGDTLPPIITGFIADNQTLNAPISDFELRALSDCEEEYDEETGEMIEHDLNDCTVDFSIPLTGGESNGVTLTYTDHDADGLVSPADEITLEFEDVDTDVNLEIFDTWASEYSSQSAAMPPALPGFGALMALTVLLGAAFATRRD